MSEKYDLEALRKRAKQVTGRFNDPAEFKPAKSNAATDDDSLKYRFFVLPPLLAGNELKSGTVKKSMDLFYIPHGNHWVNERPYPCPRVWDGSECEVCTIGFQLLEEAKDNKDKRQQIVKEWMPTAYAMTNIFFPAWAGNPKELHNQVMFYNAPKTVLDIWLAALHRNDAGTPEEPLAHGVFFDESKAYPFELRVIKNGSQNSYKTSRFIARPPHGPVPLIANPDGSPSQKHIDLILKLRHNLWDKIEIPDAGKIKRLAHKLLHGDDAADAGGFDSDETKQHAAPATTKPVVAEATKVQTAPKTQSAPKTQTAPAHDEDAVTQLQAAQAATQVPPTLSSEAPLPQDSVQSAELQALLAQLDGD